MRETGLLHVYYGDGKGKTTAALGAALRACGCGLPVVVAQFLKDAPSGEVAALAQLPGAELLRCGAGFSPGLSAAEDQTLRQNSSELLARAFDRAREAGLLVLDEVLDACRLGFLEEEELLRRIDSRPPALELIVTGHAPICAVLDRADYITRMCKERHPYDRGLSARRGIEY